MSWFTRLIGRLLPEDPSNDCGYGPFKLPHDHPFTRACTLHDWDFSEAHRLGDNSEKDLLQSNWDLIYRWFLITAAETDPVKRDQLAADICRYWPLARFGGNFLWEGKT